MPFFYFNDCHTPEELKKEYRHYVKKLHPDNGGEKGTFQNMQAEYETRKREINKNVGRETIPKYFERSEEYEYFRRPVKYVGIYFDYYYRFIQEHGAEILIDTGHINLIFKKQKRI